ncbi:MAG: hypothetical protein M5U09_03695 [Gammaproteobacteria bacterium]|nr:hypothetical protein [Gammaproteobacteria bacterium]
MPVVVPETGVLGALGLAHHGPLDVTRAGTTSARSWPSTPSLPGLAHDLGASEGSVRLGRRVVRVHLEHHRPRTAGPDRRQLWHNSAHQRVVLACWHIEDARPVPRIGTTDGWDGVPSQVIHEARPRARRASARQRLPLPSITLDQPGRRGANCP